LTTRALDELTVALASRDVAGLGRRRRAVDSPQAAHVAVKGREVRRFGSNDYLGRASGPRLLLAAIADGA